MSTPIPLSHAASLALTLDAICRETAGMVESGELTVSADDLIGGPGEVRSWWADLTLAIVTGGGDGVRLPSRDLGGIQPVVYTLSAILVWAAELAAEGRSVTTIPLDALAAWEVVEDAAGLKGRTAAAIGLAPGAVAAHTGRGPIAASEATPPIPSAA